MVTINGETQDVSGKKLTEYLLLAGYDIKRIAIELNGEILPKSEYDKTVLSNGDKVEIVSFVGGG